MPFKREKRSHVQNNVKHEALDDETSRRDDPFDEFDDLPTRNTQNAGGKTKKRTVDDLFDEFDDIPSAKSKNTQGSRAKKKTVDDLFDEFDGVDDSVQEKLSVLKMVLLSVTIITPITVIILVSVVAISVTCPVIVLCNIMKNVKEGKI